MPSMIDVSCPKCSRRFGWCGEMIDRPPCPRCGHQLPVDALGEDQVEVDAFRRLLASRERSDLQNQRIAAGLTLRQAAKLLSITPSLLADCEWGRCELSADLAQAMARLYGDDK